MMRNTKIFAIAVGVLISTGVFAARVSYTMLQPGQETSCSSSSSGSCPVFVHDAINLPSVFYYNTATHQFVLSLQSGNLKRMQFINNKFTFDHCSSNSPSGNQQPEPLSYCQNPQNYYDLSTATLVYHPHSQLITETEADNYTFDDNGSIGWTKATLGGEIFSPGNAF